LEEKPALDYNYNAMHYATPYEVPDLSNQVKSFLLMPVPKRRSRKTLWIFSFGTWEVWNIAAMPRSILEDLIISMARLILEQAGFLFGKSLDPNSIPYSGLWINITEPQTGEPIATGAMEEIHGLTVGSFHLLIPTILDISLTPGWQGRSKPPAPNSVAEQTRNAGDLTKLWNQEVGSMIADWNERITEKPSAFDSEQFKVSENSSRTEDIEPVEYGEHTTQSRLAINSIQSHIWWTKDQPVNRASVHVP
jgi:hypothetical protein